PPELQEVIGSPFAAVRTAAVQELARVLRGTHAGRALAARLALERLTEDDSRTVAAAAAEQLRPHREPPTAEPARQPATEPARQPATEPARQPTPENAGQPAVEPVTNSPEPSRPGRTVPGAPQPTGLSTGSPAQPATA